MERRVIQLTSNEILNYLGPIEILPNIAPNEFYDILKIVWKFRYKTQSYNYSGDILFKIGSERIATLQQDSLSSDRSNASISNSYVCINKDCPFIEVGLGVDLELPGTLPTVGDGEIQIDIYYYIDSIGKNWDS